MLSTLKLKTIQLRGFIRTVYIFRKRGSSPLIKSGVRFSYSCTKWDEFGQP